MNGLRPKFAEHRQAHPALAGVLRGGGGVGWRGGDMLIVHESTFFRRSSVVADWQALQN